MNQLFDAGRWWLLVAKHWSENRKKYSLSLIALAGLLLLWFIIMLASEGARGIDASMQSATYYFGLFLAGCLYASILFADLSSKTRGLNYLVVPASHLEKLLCSLFYCVIIFFTCYTAVFYTIDFIMVKASNAIAYSHWLKHHAPAAVFDPQKLFNVFYQPEHSHEYQMLFYVLLFYFVLQSAFIFGSVYFPKFSFIKTVIALLLVGLVIAFVVAKVIVPILPRGSYFNSITSYRVYTVKETASTGGIMVYSDPAIDKLLSLPAWINGMLLFLLKYAFAPLFWLATYYRLKEKEI